MVVINDLLIVIQIEEQRLAILDVVCLHTPGFHGRLVIEVVFDSGVNFTPIETIGRVLIKRYGQVW